MVSHVTEVAEGVHRLTNGVANFYLIQASGKLVLVDAGTQKDWALFTRAARTLGKADGNLDAVLLTHAHTDHTGFVTPSGLNADTPQALASLANLTGIKADVNDIWRPPDGWEPAPPRDRVV
ncbi:MAG TPA: MBL fold metallo-hydrolase [Streptosporangiaceae bacterium]